MDLSETDKQALKGLLSKFKWNHIALMGGVILFLLIVSTLLTDPKAPMEKESFDTFKYIVPIISIGVYFAGRYLGNSMSKKQKGFTKSLKEKLEKYKTISIIRLATMEGPALFAIVAALLANAHLFFAVALFFLFLMYLARPSIKNIEREVHLTKDEVEILENLK